MAKLQGMDAVKEKVASLAWLAREIGVTRGAIAQWSEVPADRLESVSIATGIPPETLRPDLAGLFARSKRKSKPTQPERVAS